MTTRKKIAVLGGGIGGLAAAYALTEGSLADEHEVTVYQMGWRLGGKGASGRNPDIHQRVEEHGLHIWLGCYENAFRMLRRCYEECAAAGLLQASPFQTIDDAFEPQNVITMMEELEPGVWEPWVEEMPTTDKRPGDQPQCISLLRVVQRLLDFLDHYGLPGDADKDSARVALNQARRTASKLDKKQGGNAREQYLELIAHLDDFHASIGASRAKFMMLTGTVSHADRRRSILIELAATLARGIVHDVLMQGHVSFDVIDHVDFRAWLQQHGASAAACNSAPVRAAYEIVFAYEGGDDRFPSYAAGVAARFMLRWVLTYEGSLIFRMKAGMGDIVMSPIYLALKHRGVKFEFFHRIKELHLSADHQTVASIEVERQVDLLVDDYDPLTWVNNVPCWSVSPMYVRDDGTRQIPEAQQNAIEQLKRDHPGMEPLESAFSPWVPVSTSSLAVGSDFDHVVLAIPPAALPLHCRQLIDHNPRFAEMVNQLPTVGTQSFQLWLTKTAAELGFNQTGAILDSYLDSWADFSQLIEHEEHPADTVKSIAYFSRTLKDSAVVEAPEYYTDSKNAVETSRRDDFLNGPVGMRPIWTEAYDGGSGAFDWNLLVDTASPAASGPDRFLSQYWTANVNPTDRYAQSLAGSTQYRLKADESGYDNVVMAGTWTDTGVNAGCIEGATIGGFQAARAISGSPQRISGEDDFCPEETGCLTILFDFLRPLCGLVQRFCPEPSSGPLSSDTLPRYIERSGDPCFQQPFEFIDVNAHAFLIDADRSALQSLVDRHLNQVSEPTINYRVPVDTIVVACCDVAKSRPIEGFGSTLGYVPEKSFSIWIPVIAFGGFGSLTMPFRIGWYHPYMFVDQDWALCGGREIYGFAKSLGKFQYPDAGSAGSPSWSVSALAAPFGGDPEEIIEEVELARISIADGSAIASGDTWGSGDASGFREHLVSQMFRSMEGSIPFGGHSIAYNLNLLTDFTDIRMVFLKQFRDTANAESACYQSIVEAIANPYGFDDATVLENNFEVHFQSTQTHPFQTDLGLAGDTITARHALRTRFSFRMNPGASVAGEGS